MFFNTPEDSKARVTFGCLLYTSDAADDLHPV